MESPVTVLSVSDLSVNRNGRFVVRDVSFSAMRGDVVAVMGASGAGKTAVIRAIAGLEPIAAGSIEVDGMRLAPGAIPHGAVLRDLHARVGIVFQFHHLFSHMTALDNVRLALIHVRGESRHTATERGRALLDQLGISARANAMPSELSGGEAQRVAIARALAMDPPVLLMDEPTASLDSTRRGEIATTIRGLAAEGRTIVIATHDAEFARACARRILVMDDGAIVREQDARTAPSGRGEAPGGL